MSRPLDGTERKWLLELARAAIRDRLEPDGALARTLGDREPSAALAEPRGAFVTLRIKPDDGPRQLRGCIGRIESESALYRTVIAVAEQSAFEDPRFDSLTLDELATVELEISVLTPLAPIGGAQEIEIGRHGVELRCATGKAVFLPQVAAEQGWDRETLLKQLSLKAGLEAEAWRKGRIRTFEAEVFREVR